MRPTPDSSSHLTAPIRALYEAAEQTLLARMAQATGRKLDSLSGALGRLPGFRRIARRIVDSLSRDVRRKLPELVEEAYEIGDDDAAQEVRDLHRRTSGELKGKPGLAGPADVTDRLVREFHPQILRAVDDAYRRIIAETYGPVLARGGSRRTASQRALDRFAREGITGYVDKAGRRWEITSYAEMAMRSAFSRATVAGALDRYRAEDIDLLYVPDIPYGCPECEPYENEVLAIRDGVVPPAGVTIKATVAQAVGAGFLHPNCRHSIIPWTPGLHIGAAPDRAGYEATQRQRALERGVRQAKRRLVAAQEGGADDAMTQRLRREVAAQQAAIRAHLRATPGHLRQPAREQVRGPGEPVERAV